MLSRIFTREEETEKVNRKRFKKKFVRRRNQGHSNEKKDFEYNY